MRVGAAVGACARRREILSQSHDAPREAGIWAVRDVDFDGRGGNRASRCAACQCDGGSFRRFEAASSGLDVVTID